MFKYIKKICLVSKYQQLTRFKKRKKLERMLCYWNSLTKLTWTEVYRNRFQNILIVYIFFMRSKTGIHKRIPFFCLVILPSLELWFFMRHPTYFSVFSMWIIMYKKPKLALRVSIERDSHFYISNTEHISSYENKLVSMYCFLHF